MKCGETPPLTKPHKLQAIFCMVKYERKAYNGDCNISKLKLRIHKNKFRR
jgi:hypothetical protein